MPTAAQGSDPGGGKRGGVVARSRNENRLSQSRSGPAGPGRPSGDYSFAQRDHVVFRIFYLKFPSHRKISILPRRSELLPLLS